MRSARHSPALYTLQRLSVGLSPPVFALFLLVASASGAERPTIWTLQLGATVSQMPSPAEFGIFGCGSNGGPPLARISGWRDFHLCPADEAGLHEVYFEYDDEAAYVARARDNPVAARGAGTEESAFPVITSALFDAGGVLRKLRFVTDPRPVVGADSFIANVRPRDEHYLLGPYLYPRVGMDAARDCHDLAPAPGETPVFDQFVKIDCVRIDPATNRAYSIEQRYLRKPGQGDIDGGTGLFTTGEYESQTRVEIKLLTAEASRDRP